VVARRNMTVAVVFGSTLLGAIPVWLWGNAEQRAAVARGLLDGALVCFAVSEPDHGSDLASNETTTARSGGEFVLSGEKWPVGNAVRGRFVTVYATVDGTGPSLLLLDKERLEPGTWHNRPAVRTVGLRGHDVSGIVFQGTRVPASALLGRPGGALASVLQVFQITRTMVGALSLGTMDAVLRIALRYARERELYGRAIYRIPVIRRHLLGSYLDLLVAECVVLPVTRAISVAPSRLGLWSAVVKYLVPTLGEEVVQEAARVLGARGYLREGVASGVFQKLQRDHAIASVFDGTTHISLFSIAAQLPPVARVAESPARGGEDVLRRLFDSSVQVPAWTPSSRALRLTNASEDEITRGWEPAAAQARQAAEVELPAAEGAALVKILDQLSARRTAFYTQVADSVPDASTAEAQDLAVEHCVHHAAASCLYTWLYSFEQERSTPLGTGWLVLVLQRLLRRLDSFAESEQTLFPALEESILGELNGPHYFSLSTIKATAHQQLNSP
jgi:alkylation response protein AidB-like acyl-CoA dehydrogenase